MNGLDSTNKPSAAPGPLTMGSLSMGPLTMASLPNGPAPAGLVPTGAIALTDSAVVPASYLAMLNGAAAAAGSHLPPAVAGVPTMTSLAQALRRRWPLALGLALAAAALMVAAVFALMPAKYAVQTRLQVAARGDIRVFGEGNDETEFALYKANMAAMIKYPGVLYAALTQKTSSGRDVKDLAIVRDNGVDWLEFALKTDFLLGPEILKVVLSTDRPDEGAELLNAVARAFVDDNHQKDIERRDRRLKEYKENLAKLEQELNGQRLELRKREIVLKVPDERIRLAQYDAAQQQQLKAGEAVSLNRTEQIKAREELASAQERLKKMAQLTISPEKVEETFRKDDRAKELLLEATKIEKEISDTKANGQDVFVTDQLRGLMERKRKIAQRLDELKSQLRPEYEISWRNRYADELQDRMRLLQDNLATLDKQETALRAELKRAEDAARQLAPGSQLPIEIVSLRGKIANLEASYGDVARTIQKMIVEVVNPRVSILQPASEPKTKDYSRQTKLAGAGGLGAFVLVMFGVAFLEFRSRKISGADDVAHGLGLNVVGSLPPIPIRARKVTGDSAAPRNLELQSRLNESSDAIRTMLLHASRSENVRIIMVTSALGGEGKTSLASQLAASLARAWRKTLLIDGDLRKPAAHKLFDISPEPGFSELLRNEVAVNDAIKPTAFGRLWLMPAGHCDGHAVQALAQDSVHALFEQLKQQFDFIIIDSSPVLPVADALLLGQNADSVVFAILRDVSRAPAVHAARQKIDKLGIRMLGAVLIGANSDLGDRNYAHAGRL
jgi:capsular exopolysaccharide synthesis family protein